MRINTIVPALALFAAPVLAADGISTNNPITFRAQMAEMGYAPDAPDPSTDGNTVTFVLHLKDETLAAVLAGCKAGLNCTHLVLAGHFSGLLPPANWVTTQNIDYDLVKFWRREDGKLSYSAGAVIEGMPRATFRRWIDAVIDTTDDVARGAIKAGYGPKK